MMLNTLVMEAEKKEKKENQTLNVKCHHLLEDSGESKDNVMNHNDTNDDDNEENIDDPDNTPTGNNCKRIIQDVNNKTCKKCLMDMYWNNNKHHGCNAGKDSFVFKGQAVTMTKVDVQDHSFCSWGLYNYYRMQVNS